MPSKEHTHHSDKSDSTKHPPIPKFEGAVVPHQSRPASLVRKALLNPRTLAPSDLLQLQRTIGNRSLTRLLTQPTPQPPAPREENKTGLPDNLRASVEALSGLSLDDVKVRFNSSRPADLQAVAFTQGTEIHVGPGQERHVAHEAWHVVQQKQGRVTATRQAKGAALNDNALLEREADEMGAKAVLAAGRTGGETPPQRKSLSPSGSVIQAKGNLHRVQVPEIIAGGAQAVEIGDWLPTKGKQLYSTGYAGCLAIVVNDPSKDVGALAHVYDADVRGEEIQKKGGGITAINTVAQAMIASTGKPVTELECLIWAGIGVNGTIVGGDYTAGLAAMKWLRFIDDSKRSVKMKDYGVTLLYDPTTALCTTGNLKIELFKGKSKAPLKIPDYGGPRGEEEERASESLFAGLTLTKQGEQTSGGQTGGLFEGMTLTESGSGGNNNNNNVAEVRPGVRFDESTHRGKMATRLLAKAQEYLERSGDRDRFEAFNRLLGDWALEKTAESPYLFMASWKKALPL